MYMNTSTQRKNILPVLAVAGCVLAFQLPAGAQTLYSDHANAAVASDNGTVNDVGNWELWSGGTPWLNGGNNLESSIVIPFQLPSLGNINDPFATAVLGVTFFSVDGTPAANLDLYGLGVRSTSDVLSGDYFSGALDSSSGITLLEDNIITPSTSMTSADSPNNVFSTDLASYLNTAYNGGANAGDYVFLRFSYDQSGVGSDINYHIESNPGSGTPADYPQISYTLAPVPEPSSLALTAMGLAGAFVLVRRRARV